MLMFSSVNRREGIERRSCSLARRLSAFGFDESREKLTQHQRSLITPMLAVGVHQTQSEDLLLSARCLLSLMECISFSHAAFLYVIILLIAVAVTTMNSFGVCSGVILVTETKTF